MTGGWIIRLNERKRELSAEARHRNRGRGVLPVDVEIAPEVAQHLLADRAVSGCSQELFPDGPHLVVRDRGKGRIGQSLPADARGLFDLPGFHMPFVKVEEVQEGILVELVLDVAIHDLIEEPLRGQRVSKGIQELSSSEPARICTRIFPLARSSREQRR